MNYEIVNSGSDGNATVIANKILIDCGVAFKRIKSFVKDLQLVLLTHIHQDHFNKQTIRRLAEERPTIRFGCCEWLVQDLIECGVNKRNIDIYEVGKQYGYNESLIIKPIKLYHDVPQCGYRIYVDKYLVFYATDTKTLDGVSALEYDYYFVEANYINEDELHERAYSKFYEKRVKNTHLSQEYTTSWLLENMGTDSVYEFMHQHKDKERKEAYRDAR